MNSNTDIVNNYTYQLGPGRHILYFGDPMCSWCWGFAPVVQKMFKAAQDKASFNVITTGLRPDVDQPWDEQQASLLIFRASKTQLLFTRPNPHVGPW